MAYNQCDHQHISIIHYLQNQARPQDDEFIIVIEQLDHPELHRADGGRQNIAAAENDMLDNMCWCS